jgi:LmbE family N-acetylglucosaminyl deacetylase
MNTVIDWHRWPAALDAINFLFADMRGGFGPESGKRGTIVRAPRWDSGQWPGGGSMKLGIFISPHFDDVCFAMGAMAGHLKLPRKLLLNIFTHSDEVTNPAILKRMKRLPNVERIAETTRMRDEEDDKFAAALHFEKRNLGFEDADLLAGPEHENPVEHYEGMDGEIDLVTARLRDVVREIVAEEPESIVFCPLAVGEHRNHLVAIDATIAALPPGIPLILYEDMPYSETPAKRQHRLAALRPWLEEHGYRRYPIAMTPRQLAHKDAVAHGYVSQMFSGNEIFAIHTDDHREPHEALWCNAGPELIASLFGK